MDNINKKSLLEICSTISEYVLFLFPLLVDVANKIISETQLDDQFQTEMRGWVDDN